MTGTSQHRSNTCIARTLVFGAVLFFASTNCPAGLICLDLEDDSIVAECCMSSDAATPENSQPFVIEQGEDSSSFEGTGSSFGNGSCFAAIDAFDCLVIHKNPPDSWVYESNKVRSKISPFDLLRPPQV